MNRKQLIAVVALLAMMLCLPIKAAKTYWGYCNGVDPVAFGTKNTGKCAIFRQMWRRCTKASPFLL